MNRLPKLVTRRAKRIGRGMGSGKGSHTVGKGQKGQKTRHTLGILFEGLKMKKSLIKRLPFARGKGKGNPSAKPVILKIDVLNVLPNNSIVDLEALIKAGIVKGDEAIKFGVKVLGGDKLEKKLTVKVKVSKTAAAQIEKAGGKVE